VRKQTRLVRGMAEKWTRSWDGRPAVSPVSSGPVATRRCRPRIGVVVFSLHHSVHRCLTQLLVVQRQQAFDYGGVLLADHPLRAFRCHRQSVLERRLSCS
jgi:hypothetical protein